MEEKEAGPSPEVALWRPPPTAVDLLKELQQQAGGGGGEADEGEDGAAAACCSSLRRILHLSSLLPAFCNKALAVAESLLQAHVTLASSGTAAAVAVAPSHLTLSRLVEFSHIARCSETLLSLIARYNAWAPRAWASTVLLLQKETPFNPVLRASLAQTLQELNHFAEELLSCHEELRKMKGPLMAASQACTAIRASPLPSNGYPCLHVCVLIISITLACALLCFVSN